MPLHSPDHSQTNRVAIRLAAGVASMIALVAVLLHQGFVDWIPSSPNVTKATPSKQKPRNVFDADSLKRRIDFCAKHVTLRRSFVVFESGTCVIVNEPTADPIAEALRILKRTAGPNALFVTKRIENDHLMVTYREPVFQCLFADEIAQITPSLDQALESFLSPTELESKTPDWNPPTDAKLGFFGRFNLYRDANARQIAKVIRARPISDPENPDVPDSPVRTTDRPASASLQVRADGSMLAP